MDRGAVMPNIERDHEGAAVSRIVTAYDTNVLRSRRRTRYIV